MRVLKILKDGSRTVEIHVEPADRDECVYTFGPFRLDPRERVFSREGTNVPLTPKVFDTLLLLVRNSGRLVTKDEFMRTIWPDSFVEELNLNQNISVLRKILGETAQAPRYILTVPGRGYRFAADVAINNRSADEPRIGACEERHWRRLPKVAILLVVVVVLMESGLYRTIGRHRPRLDLQTMRISRLTEGGNVVNAAISPDGRYLAYAEREGGKQSLWVLQIATGGRVQVVPPERVGFWGMTFSLDGNYLYLVRTTTGMGYVYKDRRSVNGPSACGDGRYIVFESLLDRDNVWRMDFDGTHLIRLSDGKMDQAPDCSPDGTWVVYASDRSGHLTLWRMPVEGGRRHSWERTPRIKVSSIRTES